MTTCTCGHAKTSHHYLMLIGDNTGRCLSLKCTCEVYEEESE